MMTQYGGKRTIQVQVQTNMNLLSARKALASWLVNCKTPGRSPPGREPFSIPPKVLSMAHDLGELSLKFWSSPFPSMLSCWHSLLPFSTSIRSFDPFRLTGLQSFTVERFVPHWTESGLLCFSCTFFFFRISCSTRQSSRAPSKLLPSSWLQSPSVTDIEPIRTSPFLSWSSTVTTSFCTLAFKLSPLYSGLGFRLHFLLPFITGPGLKSLRFPCFCMVPGFGAWEFWLAWKPYDRWFRCDFKGPCHRATTICIWLFPCNIDRPPPHPIWFSKSKSSSVLGSCKGSRDEGTSSGRISEPSVSESDIAKGQDCSAWGTASSVSSIHSLSSTLSSSLCSFSFCSLSLSFFCLFLSRSSTCLQNLGNKMNKICLGKPNSRVKFFEPHSKTQKSSG